MADHLLEDQELSAAIEELNQDDILFVKEVAMDTQSVGEGENEVIRDTIMAKVNWNDEDLERWIKGLNLADEEVPIYERWESFCVKHWPTSAEERNSLGKKAFYQYLKVKMANQEYRRRRKERCKDEVVKNDAKIRKWNEKIQKLVEEKERLEHVTKQMKAKRETVVKGKRSMTEIMGSR